MTTVRDRTQAAPTLPRLGPLGWRGGLAATDEHADGTLPAAVGGDRCAARSIWPQRSINPTRTADYIDAHPKLGPLLDRLGFFEVCLAVVLGDLFVALISLVGCIVPRTRIHLTQVRLARRGCPRTWAVAAHARVEVDAGAGGGRGESAGGHTGAGIASMCVARPSPRRRATEGERQSSSTSPSSGNRGVAAGHIWGWKGDVIVPVGNSFADTMVSYDTLSPGPRADPTQLPPFSLHPIDKLDVSFEDQVTGAGSSGSRATSRPI